VFGWSRPFSEDLISADELQQLHAAQVLQEEQGLLRSRVRWSSLDDLLLVHSAYPTEASDAVFFGPDSYRFAQVIHDHLQRNPTRVQHAVDIGCGSGVGALLIARAAQHAQVSAVDINPLALRYTAINAALAGVGNVSVEPSDLLDGISGQFDLIVANPPYMLDAGQRTYRHGGGALGAELSLRIVEQARERLSPGGSLLLYTGVAIVEGRDALLEAIRLRLAGPEWGLGLPGNRPGRVWRAIARAGLRAGRAHRGSGPDREPLRLSRHAPALHVRHRGGIPAAGPCRRPPADLAVTARGQTLP
jgi:Methylase of polypeptide chain release factors